MIEELLLSGKIRVHVKPILMELVPAYLKRRDEDVANLHTLLLLRDFEAIRTIGHKLCGNASTYGFHEISKIGLELETAAKCQEVTKIEQLTHALTEYLGKIEVISH